jgi:four helix bundle protein
MLNSKPEILNTKQTINLKSQNNKHYNLDERTFEFAKHTIDYTKNLPKTLSNIEISKQLVRASSSVGANYIEGEECLSKKDFVMRIKICKKEAKESRYWFRLSESNENQKGVKEDLIQESVELMKIFGSIVERCK